MAMPRLLLNILLVVGAKAAVASTNLRGNGKSVEAALGWQCYQQTSALPTFTRQRFPFCKVLEADKALLYWNHDHSPAASATSAKASSTNGNATLTMGLVVRVSGGGEADWVALGLSDEGTGMKGMDVAMLWVDNKVLEDRFSVDYEAPVLDKKQDKTLIEATVLPALPLASFVFTMPASNCLDPDHDVRVRPSVGTFVTYAHGKRGTEAAAEAGRMADTDKPRQPAYHSPTGRGGGVVVPLLISSVAYESLNKNVTLPPDTRVMRLELSDFEVPADRVTTYMCTYFKAPNDRKYHIYDVSLHRGEASRHHMLHHTNVFVIASNQSKPLGQPFDCTDQPADLFSIPFIGASAGGLWTPPGRLGEMLDAASAFGGETTELYWLLEVHYENPQGLTGIKDTTAFEVAYSPTLRTHSFATMIVGMMQSIPSYNVTSPLALPPGLPSVDAWGLCSSSCLTKMMGGGTPGTAAAPSPAVGKKRRVLAAALHMHVAGRGGHIVVEHADGSSHVLVRQRYFDIRTASSWRHFPIASDGRAAAVAGGDEEQDWPYVGPGDRVITRCNFNTTLKTNVTRWGPSGTRDEMCYGMVILTPMEEGSTLFGCLDQNGVHSPPIDSFERMVSEMRHVDHVDSNMTACVTAQQFTKHFEDGTLNDVKSGLVVGTAQADLAAFREAKAADPNKLKAASEVCSL